MVAEELSFWIIMTIVLTLLISTHSLSFADTIVEDTVSGNWDMAGSPYFVTDNCNVPTESVLTIHPGVQVIIGEGLSSHVLEL